MPWAQQAQKLVSVSTTSLSMTGASTEALKVKILDKVFCICHPVQFCKDKGKDILALLDSRSEINVMTPAYAAYLGLRVRITNIGTPKNDKFSLATYGMAIASFQVVDKLGHSWIF